LDDCSKGEEKRKREKRGEERERIVQSTGSSFFIAFSLALVMGIYVGHMVGEKNISIM